MRIHYLSLWTVNNREQPRICFRCCSPTSTNITCQHTSPSRKDISWAVSLSPNSASCDFSISLLQIKYCCISVRSVRYFSKTGCDCGLLITMTWFNLYLIRRYHVFSLDHAPTKAEKDRTANLFTCRCCQNKIAISLAILSLWLKDSLDYDFNLMALNVLVRSTLGLLKKIVSIQKSKINRNVIQFYV